MKNKIVFAALASTLAVDFALSACNMQSGSSIGGTDNAGKNQIDSGITNITDADNSGIIGI